MHHPKQTPERDFMERGTAVTYAHNLSGNFTFLSEEGERISGYSCEEACQMSITELLEPEVADRACEQIMRDTTKRVGTVYEIDLIAKDGRRVPLEVSTQIVMRDGNPLEVQGIAVPSVIRAELPTHQRARSLNEASFFSSSTHESDITIAFFD
jgi:PAS domain S-box-containing protein